jgi:hypothetical protein
VDTTYRIRAFTACSRDHSESESTFVERLMDLAESWNVPARRVLALDGDESGAGGGH